ncbi:Protein of unknown function DUF58 [Clostridium cavendishii DSM 21758]|uniref:DUF58 domain-containing protein n=1 Tax=Clostridium cavendishii DSM 21758 TaxID=1121302 RepID=A0A1M6I6M9_9CLOT|nr:DUF58 domain-containing protein [Clostridium cavendishii]SHJ30062.1 Protein of unknown function DUF58 [Clostridium cavendishii DSM 21758]
MGNIVIFILIVFILFIYAYIAGGQVAIIIAMMFIIAPIISIILTLIVKRKIEIYTYIPNVDIEKDEVLEVNVTIKNNSIMPIPFIDIVFFKSLNLELLKSEVLRCTIAPHETITFKMPYRGALRGKGNIGIRTIVLKDYLGILKLPLLNYLNKDEFRRDITVMPRIFDVNQTNKELFNFINVKKFRGDGEEHEVNDLIGEPGYELREYIPGDSLRRINWKVSAKRNTLMVRKSIESIGKKRVLILDPCKYAIKASGSLRYGNEKNSKVYNTLNKEILIVEERTLEFLISVADSIVKNKNNVEIYLFENDMWKTFNIKDKNDISSMQYKLATYKFLDKSKNSKENRLPISEFSRNIKFMTGGEAVVFTGYPDKRLSDLINQCESFNTQINTIWIKSSNKMFIQESCVRRNIINIMEEQSLDEVPINLEDIVI